MLSLVKRWVVLFLLMYLIPVLAVNTTHQRAAQSVYQVALFDNLHKKYRAQTRYWLGSSVAVAPHTLATNCHVALNSIEIYVIIYRQMHRAKLYKANRAQDLCLITLKDAKLTPVALRPYTRVKLGEKVFAIGYPVGQGEHFSQGLVVKKEQRGKTHWIYSSTSATPGISGGGLFDEEGRLIGIMTGYTHKDKNISFSAAVDWVIAHRP